MQETNLEQSYENEHHKHGYDFDIHIQYRGRRNLFQNVARRLGGNWKEKQKEDNSFDGLYFAIYLVFHKA